MIQLPDMVGEGMKGNVKLDHYLSVFRVFYLADICKEVIMRLTCYTKKGIRNRLRSLLDSGFHVKTSIVCLINIT